MCLVCCEFKTEYSERKRSENWASEEKKLLLELVSQFLLTLSRKENSTSVNKAKAQVWKHLTNNRRP
ncbi:hypothetical protein R5R35_000531 [Gryllus longicercus]|uniref:Regulatory protein zeste n=1 Tax=Gryllus longicercus TaxID=2509291 RepID=A0AAN9VX29_9ORTH